MNNSQKITHSQTRDMRATHAAHREFTQMYALFRPYLETPDSEEAVQTLVYIPLLEALPRPLYTFLCQVALFRGDWTAQTAATMFSLSCAEACCAELLALDLLTKHENKDRTCFSVSAALRSYLMQMPPDDQRAQWKQVYIAFYLELARAASPHLQYTAPREWMDRLNVEAENLYAAIDISRGESFVELICHLWRWGMERGDFDRMFNFCVIALASCQPISPHHEAEINRAMGVLSGRKKATYGSVLHLRRGLQLVEDLGETYRIPFFLNHLGVVLRKRGEFEDAEKVLKRAYALWCEQDDQQGQAIVLNGLGTLYWTQDRLNEAHDAFSRSAAISRLLRHDVLAARTLENMAQVAEARGDFEAAAQGYVRSLACYQKHEMARDQVLTLNNLAVILYRLQKLPQAKSNFYKAFKIAYQHGYFADIYCIMAGMAQVEDQSGKRDRAIILLGAYEANLTKYSIVPDLRFREDVNCLLDDLRTRCRPSTFARLWKRGQSLSLEKIQGLLHT